MRGGIGSKVSCYSGGAYVCEAMGIGVGISRSFLQKGQKILVMKIIIKFSIFTVFSVLFSYEYGEKVIEVFEY